MKSRLTLSVLAASVAVSGLSLLPIPAQAAEWVVDQAKSSLGFSGTQSGAAFSGKFTHWDAKISFDPANPSSGTASVTIDTASAKTGDLQKDESLPQADWFDSKSFPQAKFEANGFKSKGGKDYDAAGSLTIRGIHKDVTLPFTLDITGDTAHAKGKLILIRTDYGVGQGAWSTPQTVALEVGVDVDLVATKKP